MDRPPRRESVIADHAATLPVTAAGHAFSPLWCAHSAR
jgi:hypothetical protein